MALYSIELLNKLATKSDITAEMELKESAARIQKSDSFHIFLSHSSLDNRHIHALKTDIERMGFRVYVDWDDDALDRNNVSRQTAETLKNRMKQCKSLFYVISPNAKESRWMPWELGLFDGHQGDRVALLPILDLRSNTDSYKGSEYLELYPYVTRNTPRGGNQDTLWIRISEDDYVRFDLWLQGDQPTYHQ